MNEVVVGVGDWRDGDCGGGGVRVVSLPDRRH